MAIVFIMALSLVTVTIIPDLATAGDPQILYPYGSGYGDVKTPLSHHLLGHNYTFYGHVYRGIWLSTNGVLAFYLPFTNLFPSSLPLEKAKLVLLFWADHDYDRMSGLWSRETDHHPYLHMAKQHVTDNFPSCSHFFEPKALFIATWDLLPGDCSVLHDKRNSYQVVLVTGERDTYAIFNYERITWTEGCPMEGNRVGFNAGDKSGRFYELPHSNTPGVLKLAEESNVGIPGRWMFKVDGDDIQGPGCVPLTDSSN